MTYTSGARLTDLECGFRAISDTCTYYLRLCVVDTSSAASGHAVGPYLAQHVNESASTNSPIWNARPLTPVGCDELPPGSTCGVSLRQAPPVAGPCGLVRYIGISTPSGQAITRAENDVTFLTLTQSVQNGGKRNMKKARIQKCNQKSSLHFSP